MSVSFCAKKDFFFEKIKPPRNMFKLGFLSSCRTLLGAPLVLDIRSFIAYLSIIIKDRGREIAYIWLISRLYQRRNYGGLAGAFSRRCWGLARAIT